MDNDILYLASASIPRQKILTNGKIPYKVISHKSDEQVSSQFTTFHDYVLTVAKGKMKSVRIPQQHTVGKEYVFVLTADTLIRNPRTSDIFGKPIDKKHAITMLGKERDGAMEVFTACCLHRMIYNAHDATWSFESGAEWVTSATVEFHVDQASVERYLTWTPTAMLCSGAATVEDYGMSFFKSINGSYTAVLGLPLFELRQELKQLGFVF